MKDQGESNS